MRTVGFQIAVEKNLVKAYRKKLEKAFRQLDEDEKHGEWQYTSLEDVAGHANQLIKFIDKYQLLQMMRDTNDDSGGPVSQSVEEAASKAV